MSEVTVTLSVTRLSLFRVRIAVAVAIFGLWLVDSAVDRLKVKVRL